jgi:HEPN domain-containing protein
MNVHSEEILHKVSQWLAHADEDLRLAAYALKMRGKERPFRLIAYHGQQCAEKCLKAFLVYHNVDFPYTHSIRKLLKLCEKYGTWAQALKDAEELTPYAITARYPGEDEPVTKGQAQKAVKTAQKVRKQVRTALAESGIDLPAEPEQ